VSRSTGIRWRDRVTARGIAGVDDGIDRYHQVIGVTAADQIPPHATGTRDSDARHQISSLELRTLTP